MGSGKSYWGHIWAQQKGLAFYDLDTEIENSFQLPVELIFEKHGEKNSGKWKDITSANLKATKII